MSDVTYRSPEEDAAYFASVWGLSSARMQVLEQAFRSHELNAPARTAVEGVRRLISPGAILTASEVSVEGFTRKQVFNALTYLTRTKELVRIGYGKYQSPPAAEPHNNEEPAVSIRYSSDMEERDGWTFIAGGISVPNEELTGGPQVQWNHVDGPVMRWAGHLHWLTWRERLQIWLGLKTLDAIAAARWPRLTHLRTLLKGATRTTEVQW